MQTAPESKLVVYGTPISSAMPVMLAVEELGVPHEFVAVDLEAGDQRRPEFLAMNPNGKVPTIVADGNPMFEALAILQWLGERYGVERGLWPEANTRARFEAASWSTWMYVTFSGSFNRFSHASNERIPAERHNKAQAEFSAAELQSHLALLDAKLTDHPYLGGKDYSLLDLIVGSGVIYATFTGIPTKDHPNVEAWLARFQARPAYQKLWGRGGVS